MFMRNINLIGNRCTFDMTLFQTGLGIIVSQQGDLTVYSP